MKFWTSSDCIIKVTTVEDINAMFCHFRVNLSYSEVQDREMVNSDTNNHNNKKIL